MAPTTKGMLLRRPLMLTAPLALLPLLLPFQLLLPPGRRMTPIPLAPTRSRAKALTMATPIALADAATWTLLKTAATIFTPRRPGPLAAVHLLP